MLHLVQVRGFVCNVTISGKCLVCPSPHPSGKTNVVPYFSIKTFGFATPSHLEFPLTFYGEVWILFFWNCTISKLYMYSTCTIQYTLLPQQKGWHKVLMEGLTEVWNQHSCVRSYGCLGPIRCWSFSYWITSSREDPFTNLFTSYVTWTCNFTVTNKKNKSKLKI